MSGKSRDQLGPSSRSGFRLLDGYRPLPGLYDELIDAHGAVRPHWIPFLAALDQMPDAELRQRWTLAERLIHENGISFNAFADPEDTSRPWAFDGIPLILSATDWAALSDGLTQRAQLLDAILADLYGPQRLIHEGMLPAPLILGNPQFLRPCHGIDLAGGNHLYAYGADLVRGADGRWRVLSDRTEAPAGAGFALENRIVLSHCLAEPFRDNRVVRLAGYFQAFHDRLVAQSRRDYPRVVLLSQGPHSQTFFADSYTARYLNYSLAEGADLTVRSDKVYMKTVDGLLPVDVIVRQIEGQDADPLELNPDSNRGTAGLVRAVHAGNVIVANGLGSAVLETDALTPYLPAICRRLFDQDLLLPSVESWWCGDPDSAAHVSDHLDRFILRPAFRRRSTLLDRADYTMGSALDDAERRAMRARIAERGYELVGQEEVRTSTAPAWEDGVLRPRPVVLRTFVASTGQGYEAMPGGLSRVADDGDARAVSVQRGQRSKDTWVLSDRPVGSLSLLPPAIAVAGVRRTGKDLPSRAADNLFWLGRYAERAEGCIRQVRTVLSRLTEDSGLPNDTEAMWKLLETLIRKGGREAPSASQAVATDLQEVARAILFDQTWPYGLRETLSHLHRTATLSRDRLSVEAWRTLNGEALSRLLRPPVRFFHPAMALDHLNGALSALSAFSGLQTENMTRSFGWRFLTMGRRIERAVHLSELLRDLTVDAGDTNSQRLILLLEVADSFMTYRSRYLFTPMLEPVVDLLLLDETNPRSVIFQLAELLTHVDHLPAGGTEAIRTPEQRKVLALVTELRLSEVGPICQIGENGRRETLAVLLQAVVDGLPQVSELIARSFFSLSDSARSVAVGRIGRDER